MNELQTAFEHCAGRYAKCLSYRALLAERIMHRGAAASASHRVELKVGGEPYAIERCQPTRRATLVVSASRRWHVTGDGLVADVVAAR